MTDKPPETVPKKVLWEQFQASQGWEWLQARMEDIVEKRRQANFKIEGDDKALLDRREVKAMDEFKTQLISWVQTSSR